MKITEAEKIESELEDSFGKITWAEGENRKELKIASETLGQCQCTNIQVSLRIWKRKRKSVGRKILKKLQIRNIPIMGRNSQ